MSTIDHKAAMLHATAHRLGLDGYAHLLASVRRKPGTSAQLTQRLGVHENTMGKMLRWMRQLKLVHRRSYERPVAHSRMVPVWAFGPGGDIEPPDRMDSIRTPPAARMIDFATIIECLRDEALTIHELASELAMAPESGARYINLLRRHRLAYVESWEQRKTGTSVARHRFGSKHDAQRPQRESAKDMQKRHGATHRAKKRHLSLIAATTGVMRWPGVDQLQAA